MGLSTQQPSIKRQANLTKSGTPLSKGSGLSGLRLKSTSVRLRRAGGAIALAAAVLLAISSPLSAQSQEGLLWEHVASSRVQAVAISEDGALVAVGSRDNSLRLFDARGQPLWLFEAENSILGLDMSTDGQWIAVASEDRHVYLLDGDGSELWNFKAARPMNNAAIARDGSLIAATSDDRSVYVFDNKGNLLWQEELGIGVRAVDIYGSAEKARVVLGSDDGLVTIYSREGRDLLQMWLDYNVKSVSVTSNGARVLAGTGDGSAVLLNGANGSEIWRFRAEDSVNSVSLASDGSSALVGSEDGSAYLLDSDGNQTHQFRQESEVLSVSLAGNGNSLSVGAVSGSARIYDRAEALSGAARSSAQRQRTLLAVVGALIRLARSRGGLGRSQHRGRAAGLAAQCCRTRGCAADDVERPTLLSSYPANSGPASDLQLLSRLLRPISCLHRLESRRPHRMGGLGKLPVPHGESLLPLRIP